MTQELEADALNVALRAFIQRVSQVRARQTSQKNAKLLKLMENIPDDERSARFVSVVTLCLPLTELWLQRAASVQGTLRRSPRGDGGFGYDPLFVPVGYDKTYAEISAEEKNIISHRAKALGDPQDEALRKQALRKVKNKAA